jgi:hypothetical protein
MADSSEQFCPQCGKSTGATDRFCRHCGAPIAGEGPTTVQTPRAAPSPPLVDPEPEAVEKRKRGPVLLALSALLIAAVAAGAVLLAGGVFNSSEETPAPPDPRTYARARLQRPFNTEMEQRAAFFSAERGYREAMRDVNRTLSRYRSDLADYKEQNKRISEEFADEFDACRRIAEVPCPSPEYPDPVKVPSFADPIKALRVASSQLQTLRTQVDSLSPPPRMRVLHTQLLSSIDGLRGAAEHNADVLSEAVEPGEDGPGYVNEGKLKTMRSGGQLPAVRAMNREAVQLIRLMGLTLSDYDVPGGRDLDPKDASTQL